MTADTTISGPSRRSGTTAPDTERQIFDAALEVFSRKGKDGARMQEIADAAGINRALLHYYFRTKQQLYETCFGHCFERFMQTFGQWLSDTDSFADTLRAFIDGYIDFVREHRQVMRLMLNENLSGGTLLGEHLEAAFQTEGFPQRIMEDRIREAVARAEIRGVDPKQTLLTIVSACLFFFVTRPTVTYLNPLAAEDFDAFVEERRRHIFDILYYGLRSGDADQSSSPAGAGGEGGDR
jgi:TetR/AcrR family transcriptional regulator